MGAGLACTPGLPSDAECVAPCNGGSLVRHVPVELSGGPAPALLRVGVPRGLPAASGLYTLVPNALANGMPLWKATHADLWMHSTTGGRWGIAGQLQFEADFQTGAAFVFNDVPHAGRTPDAMAPEWMHCRPAWTRDPKISVESWPELVKVRMFKREHADDYGLVFAPGPVSGNDGAQDQAALAEHCPKEEAQAEGAGALRVHEIAEGSLLAKWNAAAKASKRRRNVVEPGCTVVRVGTAVGPREMEEVLRTEPIVDVFFLRPGLRPPACPDAAAEAAAEGEDAEEVVVGVLDTAAETGYQEADESGRVCMSASFRRRDDDDEPRAQPLEGNPAGVEEAAAEAEGFAKLTAQSEGGGCVVSLSEEPSVPPCFASASAGGFSCKDKELQDSPMSVGSTSTDSCCDSSDDSETA